MALRDQPYLPLYVQDFLTDEKLILCSPAATGIYIRLMCIMHKSKEYGTFLLLQKVWQNSGKTSGTCQDFATLLVKFLPWSQEEIYSGLQELIENDVLQIQGNKIVQKRMVRDNEISEIRSRAGSKGGFAKAKGLAKGVAKGVANTENENDIDIDIDNKEKEIPKRKREPFIPPTIDEVRKYFEDNGYDPDFGETRWHYYNDANWFDSKGSPVLNWKQKMRAVWFKPENRIKKQAMVF